MAARRTPLKYHQIHQYVDKAVQSAEGRTISIGHVQHYIPKHLKASPEHIRRAAMDRNAPLKPQAIGRMKTRGTMLKNAGGIMTAKGQRVGYGAYKPKKIQANRIHAERWNAGMAHIGTPEHLASFSKSLEHHHPQGRNHF